MHGPNIKITAFWWILSLLLMLAMFRSLSVYFLKNVCFIILNFLYFNFKRCWLFAVFGPAHAWVGMRIHGGLCGRSEVDLSVLLNCFSNPFFFFCPTQCIFPEPQTCHFRYIGWPVSLRILPFSTPHHITRVTDVLSHIWLLCGCSSGPHAVR